MLKPQTISTNAIKNPTNRHPEQFIGPFNILPDTKFKNPAAGIIKNPTVNFTSNVWTAGKAVHTNVNLKNTGANLLGLAALSAGSIVGIPQIGQVGQAVIEGAENTLSGRYTTLPFISLTNNIVGTRIPSGILYPDFRSKLNIDTSAGSGVSTGNQLLAFGATRRLDGYSAALRGSIKAGVYSGLSATPNGAYSTFNLDGGSISGYGWGDHDNPNAVRKDFTMRSHIAKRWFNGKFKPTVNPVELATPFRGDRVNVIDFSKRKLKDAYLWNPRLQSDAFIGMDLNPLSITQDFIKFYLTGPCFRREAGSYGKDVRGLNRLHQFEKVEIIQIVEPSTSYTVLDEMVAHVEKLVASLELPYRILRLCGGDMGFASAITYDFEVYSAAQERWLEVSSVSNFEAYQTNRLKCRFKDENGKMQFAHSLNGSSLALPRILACLLENHQTATGINIPAALQTYFGATTI